MSVKLRMDNKYFFGSIVEMRGTAQNFCDEYVSEG